MKGKGQHLILFDDTCALCWRSVNRILAWDKKKIFYFAPLSDEIAPLVLKKRFRRLKNANTLILVENYKAPVTRIWIRSRAVLRILWLLGGWKSLVGWLSFLPSGLGLDVVYMWVARRRHQFR